MTVCLTHMANGEPLRPLYKPAAGTVKPPYLAFELVWRFRSRIDLGTIKDISPFIPSFGVLIRPSYKRYLPKAMLLTVRTTRESDWL